MATIEQICEVLKAFKEGKTVQMKNKSGKWVDVPDFHKWQIGTPLKSDKHIRIKPEPLELWVVFWNDQSYSVCSSEKEAEDWVASSYCGKYKGVVSKFREVLDESE